MTYVDASIWPYRGMMMCHLFADSLDELHAMATKLGVRRWFQNKSAPHYDICRTKRKLAIQLGAREINRRETVELIMKLKPRKKPAPNWDDTEIPKHLKKEGGAKPKPKPVAKAAPERKEDDPVAPVKPSFAKTLRNVKQVDESAELYLEEDAIMKKAANVVVELKSLIMATAEAYGATNGNLRTMRGKKYEIGYLETDPSPKVDPELARKFLPKTVYLECVKQVPVVDEKKVEQLVERGYISPALLKKICRTPSPQRRIHVRKI